MLVGDGHTELRYLADGDRVLHTEPLQFCGHPVGRGGVDPEHRHPVGPCEVDRLRPTVALRRSRDDDRGG